jgi:thiol-disulfide isomerase/thioredoxin
MKVSGIRTSIIISFLYFFTSAFSQVKTDIPDQSKTTVYIFLSETCPICQSYTLTLKELCLKYPSVEFIGVFPNYYSDKKSIEKFRKEYSIPFQLTKDENAALTSKFKATITPEVFVVSNGEIIYSGRIDDSFYAIGKRRNVITSTELDNALQQITSGKEVKTTKTKAVGCIINSSK